MSCDVGEVTERLENKLCSFSKSFRHFTYVTAHSPTLPTLYLRHNSFSNPSVASPTSQFILQRSFSNLSITSPTSQLTLQPFHRFTYATAHSPTLRLLHLRHSSFSNPFLLLVRHRLFSYVTWRAASEVY